MAWDTADEIDLTTPATTAGGDVRICAEDECETRLSRYNEFDYCALHQPMVVPRMRGKVL